MKSFFIFSIFMLASICRADQILDLDSGSIQAANFASKCAASVEGNIVSGTKTGALQGLQMTFTTDAGKTFSVRWEAATNKYSCIFY